MLRRSSSGFGLVELAIGILILGIIFVGIAKLNVSNLRFGKDSATATSANQIAQFIYQRMLANLTSGQATNYLENGGNGSYTVLGSAPTCLAAPNCTQSEQAQIDLYQWKQLFAQSVSKINNLKGTVCYSAESAIPTTSTANCSGSSSDPIMIKLAWDSTESGESSYLVLKAPSTTSLAMVAYAPNASPQPSTPAEVINLIENMVIPPPSASGCTSGCSNTIILATDTSGNGCSSGQTCTSSVLFGSCSSADCSGSLILSGGCTNSADCTGSTMVGSCSGTCTDAVVGGSCSGTSCSGAVITGDCSGTCTNAIIYGNCTAGSDCTGSYVQGSCLGTGCPTGVSDVTNVNNTYASSISYDSATGTITGVSMTYFGISITAIDTNSCTNGTTCSNTLIASDCGNNATCTSSFINGQCSQNGSCTGGIIDGPCQNNAICDNSLVKGNCDQNSSCKNSIIYGTCAKNADCTGATCRNPSTGNTQAC